MSIDITYVFIVVAVLTVIIALLIYISLTQKTRHDHKEETIITARDYLFDKYFDNLSVTYQGQTSFLLDQFIKIEEQMVIGDKVRQRVIRDEFQDSSFIEKQRKNLGSLAKTKRKKAIHYVDALRIDADTAMFYRLLEKEKNTDVLFYLIRALRHRLDKTSFEYIMEKAEDQPISFQNRLFALLRPVYNKYRGVFQGDIETMGFSKIHLAVKLAGVYPDDTLNTVLLKVFDRIESDDCGFDEERKKALKKEALASLSTMTPEHFRRELCYRHDDPEIQAAAIRSFKDVKTTEETDALMDLIDKTNHEAIIADVLEEISIRCKACFRRMIHRFEMTKSDREKDTIGRALSSRIKELISFFSTKREPLAKDMLARIIDQGRIAVIITYLNKNESSKAQAFLLEAIERKTVDDETIHLEVRKYLNPKLLQKIGLKPIVKTPKEPKKKTSDPKKMIFLMVSLVFATLLLPCVFLIAHGFDAFTSLSHFTYVFSQYTVAVMIIYFSLANGIYIVLMVFAIAVGKEQRTLWSIKKRSVLFEDDLLPGISVIAPAYNEEKSIVDSVTSLLNLKYPTYEVIVVNDGSTDATLDVLIDRFDLERRMPEIDKKINTKTIKGIYVTRIIPNLLVVDKDNGGKADALNVGVNVARQPYVCGIDADSILEGDSLLKLMSVTIDEEKPYIALGGNIRPVNGCVVDHGKVEHTSLSPKPLVRFQTLEYLRAFTGGRSGWAKLNSLLIISGAFGLFMRDVLVDAGGYITSSTELKKDTVGEDMELVVRMTSKRIRKKQPYKIGYVHHAECFTELPSDLDSLLKQRNRWQRGLIDILSYHRHIFYNPHYKQIAFFAFPYYYFFEMIGPFWELIALIALIYGLIVGAFTPAIILLFFAVNIQFGIILSLLSLTVSETETKYYTKGELFVLVLFAILENFGYRQLIAMHRIVGFFRSMRDNQVWGKQKRQGFGQLNRDK